MLNAVGLIQDVQLACFAVIFGCMALKHRSDRVLRLIWYAFLVLGVGAVTELCTPLLPRWIAYGLDYETAPLSYGLLNLAIATFVGRERWTRWISFALVAAGLPFFLHWSGSDDRQLQSVAVIDLVMSIQMACSAWVLMRSREQATRSPRFTMAAFFCLFSAVEISRAAIVAFLHVSPDQFLPSLELITASVYVVAVAVLPINLVWMMNARMRQELKSESLLDPLTNLLNRRGFAEAANRELARYWRGRQDFAVAVADIDHFKQLNDTHGHASGDEVLCSIAQFFTQEMRQSDIVSRTGGEEFTFLLPVTSADEMFTVLDRIRSALELRSITVGGSMQVTATVSIGLTNSSGRRDLRLEELQREADRALYTAKRTGRNRTICFSEFSEVEGAPTEDVSIVPALQ